MNVQRGSKRRMRLTWNCRCVLMLVCALVGERCICREAQEEGRGENQEIDRRKGFGRNRRANGRWDVAQND